MVKIETINGKKVEIIYRDDCVEVEGQKYSHAEVLTALMNSANKNDVSTD